MSRAEKTFVDRMGQATEADGLSPIAGRLFATLLLSAEPRSLDDLAAELGVSKASVSTEARRLVDKGMVERVPVAGDRRDYYELVSDFFARIIRTRLERWRRIQSLLSDVRREAPELPAAVRRRIASVDALHADVIDQIDRALDHWERRETKPARTRRSA